MTQCQKRDDEHMLRSLVKQANNGGARLRIYRPKNGKYDFCVAGQWHANAGGLPVKMGGTAAWLYGALLESWQSCKGRGRKAK